MDKTTLIIGLDLSFSSTGLTFFKLNNQTKQVEKICFYRLVLDREINKIKKYTPEEIQNLNTLVYKMPTNISVYDLLLDKDDVNNTEQVEATLKAMICSKKIAQIISEVYNEYACDDIVVSIENYIMPSFSGQNQLKTVSGLITLQGFVREYVIKLSLGFKKDIKLYTPTPSANKKFFTGNGKAEKLEMLQVFLNNYDGNKLFPTVTESSLHAINDVIDSFSLAVNAYSKII